MSIQKCLNHYGFLAFLGMTSLFGGSTARADDFIFEQMQFYADLFENREVPILNVTSDAMTGEAQIRVVVDNNSELVALRQYTTGATGYVEFNKEHLTKTGAVLMRSSGRDVIKLLSPDLDTNRGGAIDMIYLTSGITDSYDTFKMDLVRGTDWYIEVNDSKGRRAITKMYLKSRKFFGKVIGIGKVEVE